MTQDIYHSSDLQLNSIKMIVLQQDSSKTKTEAESHGTLTDPAVRPGEAWSTLTAVPVLSIHTSATVVTVEKRHYHRH